MAASSGAPPPGPPRLAEREILDAFHGRGIEPPGVSPAYRLGLLVVAVAMALLPALYVGLISLVAYGVYSHAVHNAGLLLGRGGARFRLLLYATPILVGGILVLFMIKPLFARRAKGREPRALDRRQEGLLFAFVERLCRNVGAPLPARIHVDCSVNAAAGHLGLVSLAGGGLVLTIGLPLVAGLTLRQLAGVLAHEFGHFGQAAGMRLGNLIRRVNAWFARVVYERDAWDEMLVEWTEGGKDGALSLIGWIARFFVWLSRKVLSLMMLAGQTISCFLMRQMEFDADRYEARLAGSEAFAETALRLRVLTAATQGAYSDLASSWREGRLGDDLPGLIVAKAQELPPSALSAIRAGMAESRTGLFDTHPSDRERIERARAERQPGIFRLEAPASVLFRDFEALLKAVTLDEYREQLGDQVTERNLVPIAALLGRQREHDEGEEAVARYCQGLVSLGRPVLLAIDGLPVAETDPVARIVACRRGFEAALAPARRAYEDFLKAEELSRGASLASRLLQAGLKPDPRQFRLPTASAEGVERARQRAASLHQASGQALSAFDRALRDRLTAALAGLRRSEPGGRIAEAAARLKTAEACLRALRALEGALPGALELRDRFLALMVLLGHLRGREDNQKLMGQIQGLLPAIHGGLAGIQAALSGFPYPFEHAGGEVSIGAYALPQLPPMDDLGAVYEAARTLLDNLFTLYFRVLGRLVLIAEEVESAAGLAPLPASAEAPQ